MDEYEYEDYGYDDYDYEDDDFDGEEDEVEDDVSLDAEGPDFADPGGNSALRRASHTNPRNLPCPTCKEPNRLTPKDVACHYQCDECADREERGY